MDDSVRSRKWGATNGEKLISKPCTDEPGRGNGWTRVPIAYIEDLNDAVHGAGLEAVQMSRGPITGSLAFAEHDGLLFSTGHIGGRVALRGPLSETMVTLGIGVRLAGGTRHWLNEVATGNCGVFMPGDDHDALYASGSIYASVTLSFDRLEALAEDRGLIMDLNSLDGSGVLEHRLSDDAVARLEVHYDALHAGLHTPQSNVRVLGYRFLDTFIEHVGRQPRAPIGGIDPRGHARIVARARAYVLENLGRPISMDEIARAAHASRRTVFRAFSHVLDETPQAFIRRLRLHRIRQDLACETERATTVALVANRWGIGQLGRLSGWYRELFDEHPSETLANRSSKS